MFIFENIFLFGIVLETWQKVPFWQVVKTEHLIVLSHF